MLFDYIGTEIGQRFIDDFWYRTYNFRSLYHDIRILNASFWKMHNINLSHWEKLFWIITEHHNCYILYKTLFYWTCKQVHRIKYFQFRV